MSNGPDTFPVAVIGGGLAGLTAAVHLAERGIPPLVLEADSQWPGGRLQGGAPETFTHQGREWSFASEHGMHALWGDYANMRAMLERFAPLDLVRSPGEEWLYRRSREVRRAESGSAVRKSWLPAPLHYIQLLLLPRFWSAISLFDFAAAPGFLVSMLMTVGIDPIMEEIRWDGLTLDDYFRGWTPNLKAPIIGLARNLLAVPARSISLTALIAALRYYTMLRRDSWQVDYLPDNPQRAIIEPLTRRIEDSEGMLIKGARVQRLEQVDQGWRLHVEDARRGSRSVVAGRVILALDPASARNLLASSPDTAEAASKLRFPETLPCIAFRLWFDASPRAGMPGGMLSGDFEPDNFFWLERLRPEFKEWHVATGGSCLEMHLYTAADTLKKSDQDLLAMAAAEAYLAFPEVKGHFVHGVVRRNEASQTCFIVPQKADSLYVETPWQGISACGDWIGCPHPAMNMERSVVTAMAAANSIIASQGGEPYLIQPARPPEFGSRLVSGLVRMLRWIIGPLVRFFRRK